MDAKWQRARVLRNSATHAERILWSRLRQRQLAGIKFRRQYPIAGFVADFVSMECKLVIEVDGGQHSEQLEQDMQRTAHLNALGWHVIRFWNNEVNENLDGVLAAIVDACRQPHPSPPLQGRGGGGR